MRYDIAFADAIYVVYAPYSDDQTSPSTSVWMIPGSYED